MNNRLLIPFLLLLMVGSFHFIRGETPLSTVVIDVPDYTVEKIDGWDYVDIPGGGTLLVFGKPRVPFYSVSTEYPRGCRVHTVTMRERSGLMIVKDLNLSTVIWFIGSSSESMPSPDKDAGWYPEIDFDWQVSINLDGSSTLTINVFPFYYNSETKEARFYRHYEFSIDYIFTAMSMTNMATDKLVYDPGEDITVNILLNNTGGAMDIVADVVIKRYGTEEVVYGLPLMTLHGVTGEASFSMTWNSRGFPVGDYIVEVMLNDTYGNWLDKRLSTFRIGKVSMNIIGFNVEPRHFKIGDEIRMELEVKNMGSCLVSGRCIFIVREAGKDVQRFYQNFSSLTLGSSIKFFTTWNTSSAEKGAVYYIIGYVFYESQTTPPAVAMVSTNLFPIAKFSISQPRAGLGEEVTFDASGSSDLDGTVVDIIWDFGDGGKSSGQIATHSYRELGDYEVTLRVTDNEGASNESSQFIKVVMMYSLNVTSNIDAVIQGSGTYREGEIVVLSAPSSIGQQGILGILGAKYVFKQWVGTLNTTQNTVTLVFTGYVPRLGMVAIYAMDYTGVIITVSIVAVVVVVAVIVYMRIRKGKAAT